MARHHAAKRAQDIDSAGLVKAPKIQVPVAAATTFDLTAQWRLRKDARLNIGVVNLTDRKHWLWSDVRGLDTTVSYTHLDVYKRQVGTQGAIALCHHRPCQQHGA